MSATCTICAHEQQKDIDHELIGGATVRDVAGRYFASKSAVDRHRRHCLAPRVANALARHEELSQERLVSYAHGLLDRASLGMVMAVRNEDDFAHRAWFSEARKTVETLAKLGGIGRADVVMESRSAHVQVLAGMSEDELRALARGVIDTGMAELPPASVPAAL